MAVENIILVALLLINVFYCWKLNRKISGLKANKEELSGLIGQFDEVIVKASNSIAELKHLSEHSTIDKEQLKKANELYNDLSFMVDRASNAANQMEEKIALSRDVDPKQPIPKKKPVSKGSAENTVIPISSDTFPKEKNERVQAFQTIIEGIASTKQEGEGGEGTAGSENAPSSKADILEFIKSVRQKELAQ